MEERLVIHSMEEVTKAVGQWIVGNVGWSFLIFLCILSALFKLTKREIDPLGWLVGLFGKMLTKDVRKDISELRKDTDNKFEEIKKDRADKIEELKADYNEQIKAVTENVKTMRKDVDEMKEGTVKNCETLKTRLDQLEATNIRSNDLQTIRQIRAHVLDFANSCMNKRKHTKLDFENIIDENKQYKALIKKYNIENDVYKEDYEFIMKIYHRCQDEGSFLKESDA